MNLPNKLTIIRIALVPIMVIIYYINELCGINGSLLGIETTKWIILFIFVIASITDYLDGKIARKNNLVTTFGKFADPLADKILVITLMILLVDSKILPAWVPIIVCIREFIVSGYRLIAVEKDGKVIAANIWGKLKTVTQMIGLIFMCLSNYSYMSFIFRVETQEIAAHSTVYVYMPTGQYIINIIGTIMITISVIATIVSGWKYVKDGKDLFKK